MITRIEAEGWRKDEVKCVTLCLGNVAKKHEGKLPLKK